MKLLPLLVLLMGCARPPTKGECDAMLDRYLDLTEDDDLDQLLLARGLAAPSSETRGAVRNERIAERRATLAYVDAETRCTSSTTRAELACAMKAPSANDWEACFEVSW